MENIDRKDLIIGNIYRYKYTQTAIIMYDGESSGYTNRIVNEKYGLGNYEYKQGIFSDATEQEKAWLLLCIKVGKTVDKPAEKECLVKEDYSVF